MKLADLLHAVPEARVQGSREQEIKGLRYDSRQVQPADLFFAWKGQKVDGHAFVPQALRQGSRAVVYESADLIPSEEATFVRVPRAREALARMADLFYGQPSRQLQMIGITGTNGKTTTAFVTKYLLSRLGLKAGLLGTVRYEIGDRLLPATRTTPEGSDLQELLARILVEGGQAVVMEVSSHALDQGRVAGVDFRVAVWTNLTPDHLDYHQTMENYFTAKQRLFTGLNYNSGTPAAVLNVDAPYEAVLRPTLGSHIRVIGYSSLGAAGANLQASEIHSSAEGTVFTLHWEGQSYPVQIPLLGRFNVENVLAAVGVLLGLGYSVRDFLPFLSSLPAVPGRLEQFLTTDGVTVVVDYAHTPDAVENVLQTLRGLSPRRLLTVVGCGGDRDRSKRPLMSRAAAKLSDAVIFTADNPRSESIEDIFTEMKAGLDGRTAVRWIADRREAIKTAVSEAQTGDLVCVAGKGHETTQEIRGIFLPFDDREVVREIIQGRAN